MHQVGPQRLLGRPHRPDRRLHRIDRAAALRGRGRLSPTAEYPSPSLVDPATGIRLRPWVAADADALAAAWLDPAVAAEAAVPERPDPDAARRWIAGADTRAALDIAIDLVVAALDGSRLDAARPGVPSVLGEVGLARLTLTTPTGDRRTEWELGWWIGPEHRGQGVASVAVALLAGWAVDRPGVDRLVARIRPGHVASEAVARRAGLRRLGPFDGDRDLWVGAPRPTRPRTGR